MHRFVPTLALLFFLGLAVPARADLMVAVADLNLPQGGTGFLDVFIRSSALDPLDIFGIELRITTTGSTRLEFVAPPSDPHLGNNAYLFAGTSAAALVPPAGVVSTVVTSEDTYLGGDGTQEGAGVPVPASDTLLVQVAVTAATANPPNVGDTFTVSLVDSLAVFFVDPAVNPIRFGSSPGTVTITQAETIIPEPAGLTLFGLGSLGLIGCRWRRHQRRR